MPLDINLQATRAEIDGTVQFLFAEFATTLAMALASGFVDYGNFIGAELKPVSKRTPVKKAVRGVVYDSVSTGSEATLGIELTTTEVADARKVRHLLLAAPGTDLAQAALTSTAVDALVFSAPSPALLNQWYMITNAGILVREISALAAAVAGGGALVAGTDFIADLKTGMIRFINPGTLPVANVTLTISAPVINSASAGFMKGFNPLQQPVRRGYGRFFVWDQDPGTNLIMEYEPRPVEIQMTGSSKVDIGKQAELKLLVNFTSNLERALVRN